MKIMRPVPAPADTDWQAWIDLLKIRPCEKLLDAIAQTLDEYLSKSGLHCFVLGVSGGIDSSFLAALLHDHDLPFVSFSLPLATTSSSEKDRAVSVARAYTSSYARQLDFFPVYDFTEQYENIHTAFSSVAGSDALSRGNLQARLRMMFLYHIAHTLGGCVLGTDQLDEFLSGFWTLHGDVGDISPLQLIPKTTEYALAQLLLPRLREPAPLLAAIEAVPTDGLGISSSSLEQLGVRSYAELEATFLEYFTLRFHQQQRQLKHDEISRLTELENSKSVQRFLTSGFKRRGSLFFWPQPL